MFGVRFGRGRGSGSVPQVRARTISATDGSSARSQVLVQWRVCSLLHIHTVGTAVLEAGSGKTGEGVGDKRLPGSGKKHRPPGIVFIKDNNELN